MTLPSHTPGQAVNTGITRLNPLTSEEGQKVQTICWVNSMKGIFWKVFVGEMLIRTFLIHSPLKQGKMFKLLGNKLL